MKACLTMQRTSSFSKVFCSICVGVCAFLGFEPLPAADELQKERNQLGPAVLAKIFLQGVLVRKTEQCSLLHKPQ